MHETADLTLAPDAAAALYVVVRGSPAQVAHAQERAGSFPADCIWRSDGDAVPSRATLVWLDGGAQLPVRWLERLLAAALRAPTKVLAPFCAVDGLKPVRSGVPLSAEADILDALCFSYAPETFYAARFVAASLLYVSAQARTGATASFRVAELDWSQLTLYCGMFVGAAEAELVTEVPAPDAELELPWFELCDRLKLALDGGARSTLLSDPRPRLLHALHNWGGGVERFARDYAEADAAYRHLWLIPQGMHESQLFGSSQCLYDPLDQLTLSQSSISPAISSIDPPHAAYRAELARLISAYGVQRLLVSSVIGHSLSLLESGLPTAVVLHDYFPLWPKLHCDFGDTTRAFDAQELAQDSESSTPFPRMSARFWARISQQYQELLVAAQCHLIAPSASVLRNVLRIAPALSGLAHTTIGHGFRAWPDPVASGAPPARALLRIVVPGRIDGGKGVDLLERCLPALLQYAEIVLLGPKEAGKAFLGRPGISVVPDYTLSELPGLIAQLTPDLALLPRTVAETFSYSLSEMRSLSVPVLATRNGALAERIVDGVDGFLCAAEPESLIAAVRELAEHPERLTALRLRGAPIELNPRAQAARYAEVLASLPRAPDTLPGEPPSLAANNRLGVAHSALARTQRELYAARTTNRELLTETVARGIWGQKTSQELEARSAWAQSLASEIERLELQTEALLGAHAADQGHLLQVLDQARADIVSGQEQLADSEHARARMEESLSAQLEAARRDYQDILQSSSWRLTRPLRTAALAQRRAAADLRFQLTRSQTLLSRGIQSLRIRGVRATLARVLRKDAPLMHPVTLSVPDSPEQFVAFQVAGTCEDVAGIIDVSVIIPVYNNFAYTETCLRALSVALSASRRVEVIVVDDCSTDVTWQNLQSISGIKALRNPQNLGFIGACNAGALAARGTFLVFLNNDTAAQEGWLDALLDTFACWPEAGLVGAKLVYPDGRLQECGGIIFNDGSGWNYGRFGDPNDPQYGYVREVDYCSGAAIAIRNSLFQHFGGFDTLYTPAYYEDTDLAFKVRQAGLKCYVQPASIVVHFEGITSGTDLATGIKRYQVVNQHKFLARWGEVLKLHPSAPPHAPIASSAEHRARKYVLVVDAVTPMPDQDSGSLRMINLLTILVKSGCAVTFFCEGRHYHSGYAEQLQQLGIQVLYHPYLAHEPTWLAEHGRRFNTVMLSRHYVATPLLNLVREHCPQATIIFDTVDLHFLRELRQAELGADAALIKSAHKTRAQELALINQCDLTLVVSTVEQTLLKELAPSARVEILSNIHSVPGCAQAYSMREDLLFIGGFQHPPNVDAALWFVLEVLPIAHKQIPALKLHLVGSNTPAEIQALACESVIVHGFVPDIDPMLAKARVSIAPLRYGAGVKGKVNMAMAHGVPVVATSAAVEGMHCTHGTDVLIGDTPEQFAEQLVRAYTDQALWESISAGGLRNVSAHFSFEAAQGVVTRIFDLGN